MNQMTRSLAAEWVNDGILVNTVAPGVVETELSAKVSIVTNWHVSRVTNIFPNLTTVVVNVGAGLGGRIQNKQT